MSSRCKFLRNLGWEFYFGSPFAANQPAQEGGFQDRALALPCGASGLPILGRHDLESPLPGPAALQPCLDVIRCWLSQIPQEFTAGTAGGDRGERPDFCAASLTLSRFEGEEWGEG